MILNIELENQKFLDIEFENAAYITGSNREQLWKVFRTLYYYFNKDPKLTTNIYGENSIELKLDGDDLSIKNNDVYFMNNRESIYNEMVYKKDSLLFELLNSSVDDLRINRSIDGMNDKALKLEMIVQELLDQYSNNLRVSFQDITYLDMLKNNLFMGYEADSKNYPLEFMDTGILLDEFLNFLEFKLVNGSHPVWLVLYNLDSFISSKDKYLFITKIQDLMNIYDLKLIYLGNNLNNVPMNTDNLDKIIISADTFHQLLPRDELMKSIRMHYPNEFELSDDEFVKAIQRIIPYVGSKEKVFISMKDLVLLKVVNDILGYETFFDLDTQMPTIAETKFLED